MTADLQAVAAEKLAIAERSSPNHGERAAEAAIDMLILHYTGMRSAEEALGRMCDPVAEVSAHYFVGEDGAILRLVPEERRAWHAGRAFWAGATDINSRSIGIELQNPGHEFGYRPFPAIQIAALRALIAAIRTRYAIPDHRILGHSDVAPARKQDPGEFFPWQDLARHGIGIWPDFARPVPAPAAEQAMRSLATIGYDPSAQPVDLVCAFQRHWRPSRCDGVLDEETARRIAILLAAWPNSPSPAGDRRVKPGDDVTY